MQKSPKSAQAQRNLATALQEDGQTDEAIVVLNRYLELRPKDKEALQELAGLHLGRATALARDAQEAQVRASYLTFGSTFSTPLDLGEGATLGPDPIDQAVSTQANQAVTKAYTAAQTSFQKAEETYDRLAAAAPRDPNVQLELAQAAQQSGDIPKAIAAYEKFLKLAPDDPTAPIVKQQIAQLKAAQTAVTVGLDSPATGKTPHILSARPGAYQMNFDVKTEKLSDEQYVISLAGEVDLYTAPEFKQQLLEVIDQGGRDVVVDLSDTTFIDSTTLGVLVGGVKRLRTNEGQLSLVCSDRNITKIFEITGLDRVFTIHPTREAAVGSGSPSDGVCGLG